MCDVPGIWVQISVRGIVEVMACLVPPWSGSKVFSTRPGKVAQQDTSSINHQRAFYPLSHTLEGVRHTQILAICGRPVT